MEAIRDLFRFIWERKKWWMIPLVATLLAVGGLIILSSTPAVAPFIYTIF